MKIPKSSIILIITLCVIRVKCEEKAEEEFSCGRFFYRTLHLDEENDILYVGGMDRLMRIDAKNVSNADCERDTMHLEANNVANCVSKGKSRDYDCRNHIRVIQPIGDGDRIYVCGTNGHSPKDQVIYSNLTKLARHEFYPGIGDGIAKCPFDPEDNSTAIWVETGNPGEHPAIYSGTNAEFTKADTVIFRGDIFDPETGRREYTFKRTLKYDSHMLDKPDFVGSYDVGEYVYFFFREMAVEYMNCGRNIYSRVARVCKRDTGGKNILNQNWATYLKARLNCSIPGEFPFFFDEIQDVYKADYDDSTFHAVFTTATSGVKGSAICSFRLEDLERTFDGKFKEQATSTSMWLPVPLASVPEPRPGTCVPDTRELPDTVLNFIRKHPLMDGNVPQDVNGPPPFYARDVTFTKITVDQIIATTSSRRYGGRTTQQFIIYYAGTVDGKIYKVSRWLDARSQQYKSKLIDIFEATSNGEPVRAITISRENKMMYVASDSSVRQYRLFSQCTERHKNCVQCAADPYCGWNREQGVCQSASDVTAHLLQDPTGHAEGICEASIARKKMTANFGASVHLSCELRSLPFEEKSEASISWYHYDLNGKRKKIHENMVSKDKHVFTQENGLVILGMTEADAGRYDCRMGRDTISTYSVSVDMGRCSAPTQATDYQKAYSAWCNEFQKYKTSLREWEGRRRDTQCPNNISTVINGNKKKQSSVNLVHGVRSDDSSNYIY